MNLCQCQRGPWVLAWKKILYVNFCSSRSKLPNDCSNAICVARIQSSSKSLRVKQSTTIQKPKPKPKPTMPKPKPKPMPLALLFNSTFPRTSNSQPLKIPVQTPPHHTNHHSSKFEPCRQLQPPSTMSRFRTNNWPII